jgi:hypothetical protein
VKPFSQNRGGPKVDTTDSANPNLLSLAGVPAEEVD